MAEHTSQFTADPTKQSFIAAERTTIDLILLLAEAQISLERLPDSLQQIIQKYSNSYSE